MIESSMQTRRSRMRGAAVFVWLLCGAIWLPRSTAFVCAAAIPCAYVLDAVETYLQNKKNKAEWDRLFAEEHSD